MNDTGTYRIRDYEPNEQNGNRFRQSDILTRGGMADTVRNFDEVNDTYEFTSGRVIGRDEAEKTFSTFARFEIGDVIATCVDENVKWLVTDVDNVKKQYTVRNHERDEKTVDFYDAREYCFFENIIPIGKELLFKYAEPKRYHINAAFLPYTQMDTCGGLSLTVDSKKISMDIDAFYRTMFPKDDLMEEIIEDEFYVCDGENIYSEEGLHIPPNTPLVGCRDGRLGIPALDFMTGGFSVKKEDYNSFRKWRCHDIRKGDILIKDGVIFESSYDFFPSPAAAGKPSAKLSNCGIPCGHLENREMIFPYNKSLDNIRPASKIEIESFMRLREEQGTEEKNEDTATTEPDFVVVPKIGTNTFDVNVKNLNDFQKGLIVGLVASWRKGET